MQERVMQIINSIEVWKRGQLIKTEEAVKVIDT